MAVNIPTKKPRIFLPLDFELSTWPDLESYFKKLLEETVTTEKDFKIWLQKKSELESVVSENMAWRYIKMTCNTADLAAKASFEYFVTEIQPNIAPLADTLNKKTLELFQAYTLPETAYNIMKRSIATAIDLYRVENISLETQIQIKQTEYQGLMGSLSVEINGEQMPLPKAGVFLQSLDRSERENVWRKMAEARLSVKDAVDAVFDDLIKLRHQVALNAGFDNFRDYMFAAMGRFDYTPADCLNFHEAVKTQGLPILNYLASTRKEKLGLSELKPWDFAVDIDQKPALKPFEKGSDLLSKSLKCFTGLDPAFAEKLEIMDKMNHFDLESRNGKAPGGYNYPLEETGVPFIFMNASGTLRDLVTMVHEGGHALHSFAVRDLNLNAFRNPPMEVAELASMSIELLSMQHWSAFFDSEDELKRAKAQHLSDILSTLPWIMIVDKFQHELYLNPSLTRLEREKLWTNIYAQFSDSVTDWSGLEHFRDSLWHKQLHIFEVPFYYIEYGIAQLGAISMWKNYLENPSMALKNYTDALTLGYTEPIGKIYEAGGIKFDFSENYIAELMAFVQTELKKLL